MTVLDWLRDSNMYSSFTDGIFERIALDRGIDPNADVYDNNVVTERERELMDADVIYWAILKRPSNTASLSQSHNGYQKIIGSEQDFYQDDKIKYALAIYNKYDDAKADLLAAAQKKIKFIPIVDVDKL